MSGSCMKKKKAHKAAGKAGKKAILKTREKGELKRDIQKTVVCTHVDALRRNEHKENQTITRIHLRIAVELYR